MPRGIPPATPKQKLRPMKLMVTTEQELAICQRAVETGVSRAHLLREAISDYFDVPNHGRQRRPRALI